MNPKESKKGPKILMVILLYIIVMLFSFHYAHIATGGANENSAITNNANTVGTFGNKGIKDNGIKGGSTGGSSGVSLGDGNNSSLQTISYNMNEALNEMGTNPFGFMPFTLMHAQVAMVLSVILTFIIAYMWTSEQVRRHDAAGIEAGSAKWETDYNKFLKKMSAVDRKYDSKGEPIQSKTNLALPEYSDNMILSQRLRMSLGMKKNPMDNRNNSVIVIGGSGTGKTRYVLKPNVLQANASFAITDPSGDIMEAVGDFLGNQGYLLRVFSTSNMKASNHYNPFDYIRNKDGSINENKVLSMVTTYVKNNGKGAEKSSGDPFWEKSEVALIKACVLYLCEFKPRAQQNFSNVLKLILAGSNSNSSSSSVLDGIFENARSQNPDARCLSSYETFKLAGDKTAAGILVTAAVDMGLFEQAEVRDMTSTDVDENGNLTENNLNLTALGDRKTALFIIIPQADSTYNFLVSMIYSQLFSELYDHVEKVCRGSFMLVDENKKCLFSQFKTKDAAEEFKQRILASEIKKTTSIHMDEDAINEVEVENWGLYDSGSDVPFMHVYNEHVGNLYKAQVSRAEVSRGKMRVPVETRFLLDEFANIGEVPNFPEKLATMRRYGISCMIILQNIAQLKARYEKQWEGIIGNCDTFIFLGSTETETCKYVSEKLGKATIRTKSNGHSKQAKGGSMSENYQQTGRALLDEAELTRVDNKKCIVMIRGFLPFMDDKYDYPKHPNYIYTGDYDEELQISNERRLMLFDSRKAISKDKKPVISTKDSNAIKNDARHRDPTGKNTSSGVIGVPTTPDSVRKAIAAGLSSTSTPKDIAASLSSSKTVTTNNNETTIMENDSSDVEDFLFTDNSATSSSSK